jgi:2-methylcitrate dehydratase PrpD
VNLDCYLDENLRNSEIHNWAQRISVTADNNPDLNAFDPQKVSITLKSGEVLEKEMPYSLGSPTNPMSETQVLEKLNANLNLVGRGSLFEDIVETVSNLENQSNLNALFGSL